MEAGDALPDPEETVRFEDLTVDDDLPILERIVRYTRSQIALQRLVHVKMLGETAELAGMMDTQDVIVPLLSGLVGDAESVIRQHLAAQLLTVSIVCMIEPQQAPPSERLPTQQFKEGRMQAQQWIDHPDWSRNYDETGYRMVTDIIIGQLLQQLISDVDVDVRRAAADALTGLSLQIRTRDICVSILPIPLRLAAEHKPPANSNSNKKTEADQLAEEIRMTAANLLAELGGAVAEQAHIVLMGQDLSKASGGEDANSNILSWGDSQLVPAILEFTRDSSFRVRRAAAQALPRILGAASVETVVDLILPSFEALSRDDLYRVRKSTGECLVDMSRSLVILASHQKERPMSKKLLEARRSILIPIADRLIQDEHKMVRQGMMQFLGPFMASFYPFFSSALDTALPATSESDGSNHMGIVAQFFPHATSMVSRLNSSQNAVTTAPTPVLINPVLSDNRLEIERLQHALPLFLQASRRSAHALRAVRLHRQEQAPPHKDLEAIVNGLLDYFAALAIVQTGDENTDAEMRVYCAYSFPAVVLLLGPENWPGALKTCFFTLLNPSYTDDDDDEDKENDEENKEGSDQNNTEPPLPVKRCLASSLHTVAHVLGPEIAVSDILPVFSNYFLRDADEAVRLNIIRGFPALLGILPASHRPDLFVAWSRVMHGEDCLGAKKRSATNPLVLNWRQRNYLARSLPDLLHLLPPDLIHSHVWPICQQLLFDSVSLVRDDALWTIPVLLKVYTPDTISQNWPAIKKSFSSKSATMEIVTWFKDQVLKLGISSNSSSSLRKSSSTISNQSSGRGNTEANFCDRQLFCKLCGTIGLSLRLNEEIRASGKKDLAAALGESFVGLFFGNSSSSAGSTNNKSSVDEPPLDMPYQKLSPGEHKHLKKILEEQFLPVALTMKDDRIRNVRVTLLKVLQILPTDIRESQMVKGVLQSLNEEMLTWESFGEEPVPPPAAAPPQSSASERASSPSSRRGSNRRVKKEKQEASASGPVDLDDVVVTPSNSRDDDDMDAADKRKMGKKPKAAVKKNRKGGAKKESSDEESSGEEEKKGKSGRVGVAVDAVVASIPVTANDKKVHDPDKDSASKPERVNLNAFMDEGSGDRRKTLKKQRSGTSRSSRSSRASKSSVNSPKRKKDMKSKKPSTMTVMEETATSQTSEAAEITDTEENAGGKTVIFDDGPIGLQLEPTADDIACRVYGFLETGNARKSGKIQLGDVITKVNNVVVKSYDETVELLKRGGRRAVTFRPGAATDDYVHEAAASKNTAAVEDDGTQSDEDSTEDRKRMKNSAAVRNKSSNSSSSKLNNNSTSAKLAKAKRKKRAGD